MPGSQKMLSECFLELKDKGIIKIKKTLKRVKLSSFWVITLEGRKDIVEPFLTFYQVIEIIMQDKRLGNLTFGTAEN